MTKEPLYIISDDMIRQWRGACVKVPPFQEVDQCKDCEYRGKGARKGCCDFDDNAMERIFRSRPLEQEKQAAVNAVLDKFDEFASSLRDVECLFIRCRLKEIVAEIHQQTGQTSAEQQRGREE